MAQTPRAVVAKPMSSQSMLWGLSVEFWNRIGFWLLVAGGALGAFALIVSLTSSIILYRTSGAIQSAFSIELEKQKIAVATAGTELEKQKATTAEAIKRALDSQLALERYKAPRSLSFEQQHRIVEKLKKFAGTPFDLEVDASPEPIALLRQIVSVLTSAGWIWLTRTDTGGHSVGGNDPSSPQAGIIASFVGFGISIDNGQEPQWLEAVTVLGNALAEEGMPVMVNTKERIAPNAVHISIGTKH